MSRPSHARHRFPSAVIQHAVWLCFRFGPSYRAVEDLLAERGIDASCETVRRWVCAGSNFAPEAHIALYRACVVEADFARGRRIMSAMLPLIVKPAEQTSLAALRVAELGMEAGIPRGVLNIVTGDGPGTGEPLGLHPDIDMISLTGSTETGRRFLRYAAESNLKTITLECGGENPAPGGRCAHGGTISRVSRTRPCRPRGSSGRGP